MKETIVFAPATFNFGETTRMLEVANYLKDEFNCVFFGFSTKYSQMIIDAGFTWELLSPVLTHEQEELLIKVDQMKSIKNPFTYAVVSQRVKSELIYLNKMLPKIIITGTNLTIFLSARIQNLPLVYIKPYALSRPNLRQETTQPPSVLNKKFLPTNWLWKNLSKILLNSTWKPYGFRKTAKDYQLELPKHTLNLFDGDENLITTHPLFANPKYFPNNYHSVGPIFAHLGNEIPEDISKIIDEARSKGEKIIYFAMGSSSNKKLIIKMLTILESLNYLVLTPVKSYFPNEESIPPFNKNIYLTNLLPAHLVSPLVDFSIIHGGEGTVQTACLSGKPFIGVGLQYEQETNIHNCKMFGNAAELKINSITKNHMEAAISFVESEDCLRKAKEMKEQMNINGTKNAADFIKNRYFH